MALRASMVATCRAILVASRLVTSTVGVSGLPPQAISTSVRNSHKARFIYTCPQGVFWLCCRVPFIPQLLLVSNRVDVALFPRTECGMLFQRSRWCWVRITDPLLQKHDEIQHVALFLSRKSAQLLLDLFRESHINLLFHYTARHLHNSFFMTSITAHIGNFANKVKSCIL